MIHQISVELPEPDPEQCIKDTVSLIKSHLANSSDASLIESNLDELLEKHNFHALIALVDAASTGFAWAASLAKAVQDEGIEIEGIPEDLTAEELLTDYEKQMTEQ